MGLAYKRPQYPHYYPHNEERPCVFCGKKTRIYLTDKRPFCEEHWDQGLRDYVEWHNNLPYSPLGKSKITYENGTVYQYFYGRIIEVDKDGNEKEWLPDDAIILVNTPEKYDWER